PPRRPYAARMAPLDRHRQLLDAALRIIIRDGYAAVSIEAIAREVDVSRPVIYGVFAGLGDLLGALLDRQERRALAQLAAALPAPSGGQDPPDRVIIDAVRSFVEVVVGDPDTWRPILLPPEGTPKVVRERVDRDRERVRRQLEALLASALDRRGAPPEVDVELASHLLLAVGEYSGRLVLSDPHRFSAQRLAGFVEGLLTRHPGLGPPAA
ncbi:MAG TPA: helix-turn-helix domain-containing protein, partial [Solirubrobacteraceae bacterium]|nr:helix-turn-helix domain-containing protein [Solirubrobacteraceae bacterium]